MIGDCERGLTLIELLVALAVAAIVMVTVQGVFLSASELRESQQAESTRYHRSRVFIDRLERELGSMLYSSTHPQARFVMSSGNEPQLELSTFASLPLAGGRQAGAALVRYRWQPAVEGDGIELLRHERSLQAETWSGREQLLMGELEDVSLRCFDGTGWETSWDSGQKGRLPLLLEISFSVANGDEEIPFRTALEVSGGGR